MIESDQMTETIEVSDLDRVPVLSDDAQWLAARRESIGASEVAALLGVARYGSQYSVWASKTGHDKPDEPTEAMERGQKAEADLCAWFRAGVWCGGGGDPTAVMDTARRIWRHRDHPQVHATPDAVITVQGRVRAIVEAKSVGAHYAYLFGLSGSAEIPMDVWVQVQIQMSSIASHTGCDDIEAYVVASIGGEEYWRWYKIPYDPVEALRMVRQAARWYELYVGAGVMPPVDGSVAAERALRDTYSEVRWGSKSDLIPASAEAEQLARRLRRVTEDQRRAEGEAKVLRQQLMAEIGDCAGIAGNGWRITWMQAKPATKTDWEQAFWDLVDLAVVPDDVYVPLIADHTQEVPGSRRFLPRWEA